MQWWSLKIPGFQKLTNLKNTQLSIIEIPHWYVIQILFIILFSIETNSSKSQQKAFYKKKKAFKIYYERDKTFISQVTLSTLPTALYYVTSFKSKQAITLQEMAVFNCLFQSWLQSYWLKFSELLHPLVVHQIFLFMNVN